MFGLTSETYRSTRRTGKNCRVCYQREQEQQELKFSSEGSISEESRRSSTCGLISFSSKGRGVFNFLFDQFWIFCLISGFGGDGG